MEQNKKDGDPGCDIGNRTPIPNAPFPPPRPAPLQRTIFPFSLFPPYKQKEVRFSD